MIKQKQLNKHNPDFGIFGDCYRTAIACLLNLDPEEVPNFAESHWDDMKAWKKADKEFLAQFNLTYAEIAYDSSLETLLYSMELLSPGILYLLSGTSRNNTHHTVIGGAGRIYWDPAKDNSGIIGPCSDGYYWIQILVPLSQQLTEEEIRCVS